MTFGLDKFKKEQRKMKAIRILALAAAVAATATSFAASAKKGSCIKKAISLKSSQTVSLVSEYDPEEKEFYDNGVAYYSVTLKRGQAYTIWITGGNASSMSLDVDTNDNYYEDKDNEPSAGFDVFDIDSGATQVAYLYADDWDTEEDPKNGKYIVSIDGEIGMSTTLYYTTGIKPFKIVGTEESPKVVSPSTSLKTVVGSLVDGEYHLRASLKAGRKYRVRTQLGKKGKELGLDVDSVDTSDDAADNGAYVVEDLARLTNYNEAWVVVPDESGKFNFTVEGDSSQSFRFQYQMVPTRKIAAHPSIPLLEENGFKASFVPGRMASTQNYYDEIIDEHLCKIYLAKGEVWSFETEGASKSQQMIAYNSSGKVIATNESLGNGSFDTRVVISATAAGVYYVGVCDPTLDVDLTAKEKADLESTPPIVLTATLKNGAIGADGFDPADDVIAGASVMVPYPATTNDFAVAATRDNDAATALGAVHGPHRFDSADMYDLFAFACRKGFTYKLRASFDDDQDVTDLGLSAKVFNINAGKERNVTYTGSLTPDTTDEDLSFKANTNAVHYVRVWVTEGKGLDFPSYSMHAIAVNGTNAMGLVKVVSKGAEGTWSLDSDKTFLLPGTTLAVAPGTYTVRANAASGFTPPAAKTGVVVPAWNPGDPVVTITNVYSDIYDVKYQTGTKTTVNAKTGKKTSTPIYSPADGDATTAGAFAITPKAAVTTLKRTLWNNDAADTFKFTAAANTYYNFSLADTTIDGEGDAVFSIKAADGSDACLNATEASRLLLPAGVTYVTVTHGTGAKADTSYSISFSKATAGIVRFTTAKSVAANAFSASETAAAATLYVARTGTEGAARVVVETHAGTALPGTNYWPIVTNEVRWAAGDKAAKAVKVKLIPELNAAWAPSNLTFSVKIRPVDEFALEDGEYLAIVPSDTATVTIKNATAKKPGTISLSAYGDGVDPDDAVANVKKPAVTGKAGENLVLTFARTGGTDGPVAIKVSSPTAAVAKKNGDTAKAGTDYTAFAETLTWEDGDAEPKTMTVALPASANYTASKKFVFTIAAATTDGTVPALSAKTATMTILNDTVAQTAAAYAKTIATAAGLKLASTGTWFNDYDGTFRSGAANGTLTYTLTGPGLFACEPVVVTSDPEDAATLACQFVNTTAKLNEKVTEFAGRLVRVIPAGTTTVKFTLSGVKGGAYVKFAPQAGGEPYAWTKFALTQPNLPMDKAVVETDLAAVSWTLPDVLAAEAGLYCRVRFGTTAKPSEVIAVDSEAARSANLPSAVQAGKTYYWALDYAYSDEPGLTAEAIAALPWTAGPATWSFTGLKDGAPVTELIDDANPTDAAGNLVAQLIADGDAVELIQGVNVQSLGIKFAGAGVGDGAVQANKFRLLAGSLPKGVSINATTGMLTGAPTTVGTTRALLQSYNQTGTTVTKTVNGKKKKVTTYTYVYGSAVPVAFEVLPGGTMFGTYRGALVEDGSTFAGNTRHAGNLSVTVTTAGKITAKAAIAGVTYTFSGTTGYDELVDRDETLPGATRHVRVELATTVKTIKNKKVTGTYTDNSLVLEIPDGAVTNAAALAEAVGTAEMKLSVLNAAKTAVTKDVSYKADLFRSNGAQAEHKAAMAPFAGYYTVSLVPEGVSAADGVPVGNGYLTLTVAEAGTVKVAGVLADGTAVSFSTFGELVGGDFADPDTCALKVPLYVGNANYSLAGALEIDCSTDEAGEKSLTVKSAEKLVWSKTAAATTSREGTGFSMSLAPTGGWYDKVVNLQTYYLDRDFSISSAESGDDLPSEALAKGYSFTTLSAPNDLAVSLVGNAFAVGAKSLVKNKTTGLTDFGLSVNPWNTTVKLNRATGIVTGTFNAWEWVFQNDLINSYPTAQKQITSLAHKGVLLYSRDDSSDSPLAANVFTSGFFLMPATTSTKAAVVKKAWKASLPFNIIYEEKATDWFEAE